MIDLSSVCASCRSGQHAQCNGINRAAPAPMALCLCQTCWGEDG